MSNDATNFIKAKAVPYRLRLLAHVIGGFTNPRSRTCFAGHKKLAKECGCSKATVKRQLKLLEQIGVIRVGNSFRDNGSQSSNIVTIVGFGPELSQTTIPTKRGGSKCTPRGSTCTQGVVNSDPGGSAPVTPLELKYEIKNELEEREAGALSLTKDVLIDQKVQAPTATVVNLIAKPIPEGWQPNEAETAFATDSGLSAEEIAAEAASFVSHYLSTDKNALQRNWSERWKQWIRHYDPTKSKVGKRVAWTSALNAGASQEVPTLTSFASGDPVLPFEITPADQYWSTWISYFTEIGQTAWVSDAVERGTIHAETLVPHSRVKFRLPKKAALADQLEANAGAA